MGRASNSIALVAVAEHREARFASLWGARRGNTDVYALNAAVPTPEAATIALSYHRQLDDDHWEGTLQLLAANTGCVRSAPLLAELAGRLAHALSVLALADADADTKRWFAVAGIKDGMAQQVICEARGRGCAHLWRQGGDSPWLPRELIAECGHRFLSNDIRRAVRGEWDEMKQQKKVCPKCAEAAWHYPETVESFNYRVLPEEAERSLCEEGSRSFVLEGLLRALAGGGPQTQERLRWTVAPLMRARLLDFTAESAAAQGEAVIRRAISLGDYGACLRFLPDGGRRQRVCDYITLNTWRELLHEYEATARTERTVGLRSTASAVERFRNKLSRYLLSELRRYHRHPELQRPGPPT